MSSSFPERIGRYELLAPIAVGGTATVFLARTQGLHGFERDVAVKLLHAHLRISNQSRDAAAELMEEAKLAGRMRHPNIVPVLDVGDDAAGIYLVMEYVEGVSLAALLQAAVDDGQPLEPALALRILCDALMGLEAAHALTDEHGQPVNLVHRDFSPQNILVGIDGVARLLDFGIARAKTRAEFTKTGIVKGKVAYMSPEQAQGQALDQRCDVWAAGVVCWETFTGQPLYREGDPMAVMLKIVSETPPRMRGVAAQIGVPLDEAVAWALEPELERRCPTAAQLRLRLLAGLAPIVMPADASAVAARVRALAAPRLAELRLSAEAVRAARSDRLISSARAISRGKTRLWWLAAAGVAAVAATALALRPSPDSGPTPPSATPAQSETTRNTAAPVALAPRPAPPVQAAFQIQADAPIALVKVGRRAIPVVDPTSEVTVSLLTTEMADPTVELVAADGRRVQARLTDLGGPQKISFPKAKPAIAKPAARKVRPKLKITQPETPGLAPIPY